MKTGKRITRKVVAHAVVAILAIALLAGCGGGGGPSVQTGSIAGKAYDSSTGIGVGSAVISVGSLQTTTASDGRFTINSVPVGSATVTATKTSQTLTGQANVTVTQGVTTNVDIPMLDSGPPPPPL